MLKLPTGRETGLGDDTRRYKPHCPEHVLAIFFTKQRRPPLPASNLTLNKNDTIGRLCAETSHYVPGSHDLDEHKNDTFTPWVMFGLSKTIPSRKDDNFSLCLTVS